MNNNNEEDKAAILNCAYGSVHGYYRAIVIDVGREYYSQELYRNTLSWHLLSYPAKDRIYIADSLLLMKNQRGFKTRFEGWIDQDVEGSLPNRANSGWIRNLEIFVGLEADVLAEELVDRWGRVEYLARVVYPPGTYVEALPNRKYRLIEGKPDA